jgi:hypothetical protein
LDTSFDSIVPVDSGLRWRSSSSSACRHPWRSGSSAS